MTEATAMPLGWRSLGRLLRDATLVTSSNGFLALCAVVALGFNARSLGPLDYGVLSIVQAYAAFISSISAFESWQPVIRLGIKSPARLGSAVSCGVALDVLAAIAAASIAVAGVLLVGGAIGISDENRTLAVIYSVSLLTGLGGTPKGYFRLMGRYDVLVGHQIAQGLVLVIASIVLWAIDAPLVIYVIVLAAVGASYNLMLFLRLLFATWGTESRVRNPWRSWASRRFLARFLMMASGTSLLSTLLNARRHVALFIVAGLLGEAAAGLYAVASRIASMVSRLAGTINQVIFPEIVKLSVVTHAEDLSRANNRITTVAASASLCVAIIGVTLRETIIQLGAGSAFAGASLIFAILFLAECASLAGVHFNPLLQSLAGTRPLLIINSIALPFFIVIAAILGVWIGAVGIACAGLVTSTATYFAMMGIAGHLVRNWAPSSAHQG